MSFELRQMREDEAEAVAEMVRGLARHVGAAARLDAGRLLDCRDLVDIVVAGENGRIAGACLTLPTYSTFRGARGLYVLDLFVVEEARGRGVGAALLAFSARRGWTKGARFIKLEVDRANPGAARFYERLGFGKKESDRLFMLEEDGLERLMNRKE
jgi:GNAT superfamily N-acetyltransferase